MSESFDQPHHGLGVQGAVTQRFGFLLPAVFIAYRNEADQF